MLTLLSLLQARRDWPGSRLAERLQISERTVRRDVDRLRRLGYRIHAIKGPDGGYRLEAGSELPPLLFDDEQAVVLAVALQTVAVKGTPFDDAAERALAAVRQVMPSRLRHRVDALSVTSVPTAFDTGVDPRVLMVLGTAIRESEVVRFDYADPAAAADPSDRDIRPPRLAEPHDLVARAGRWYLVAWDRDRNDWRTFRVDRITPKSHGGGRFEPREIPGGDIADFVDRRFRGAAESAWPCEGEVILSLPATKVSPYLGDGTVRDLGGDRCLVSLGSWSWTALATRLGSFDADLQVVGPASLADAFAGLSRRFAAAGAGGPDERTGRSDGPRPPAQPAARLTSSRSRASTSSVTSSTANDVGQITPSSSIASSLKPTVP
jgi:predicted DNA-binding transcriptional regulator YafY